MDAKDLQKIKDIQLKTKAEYDNQQQQEFVIETAKEVLADKKIMNVMKRLSKI